MKNKFRNLFCLLILVAAGTNLGVAQDEVTVLKSRYPHPQLFQSISNYDFDKSQYQKVEDQNGVERYVKKSILERNKLKSANSAEVENATLTLIFNMPEDGLSISSIRMYNQDNYFWLDEQEITDSKLVTEIPKGNFQLLVQFSIYSDDPIFKGCLEGIIAKENVTINQDTTITINYADAKNVIYQEKKLPNGEAFTDGDFDERIDDYINQPNVQSMFGDLHFIDNQYQRELSRYTLIFPESNYIDEEGNTYDQRFRIMISDLSDRYQIIQSHTAYGIDEKQNNFYTVVSEITGVNSSENLACSGIYKTISNGIKPSILGENTTDYQAVVAGVMYLDEYNNSFSIKTSGIKPTNGLQMPLKMHVCENGNRAGTAKGWKYYYNFAIREYFDMNNFMDVNFWAPWGDITGEENMFQVITPQVVEFIYNLTSDGNRYIKPNCTFSFKESEITEKFGNNTPINVFGYYYDAMGTKVLQPICNYVGRMGESRQTDNYALDYSLLYNGEEVCSDYQQCVNGWMQQWIYGGHPDGAYDATVVNQNVMIDDMQGCNTTKVHYDTRNEDFTPPTAMMLQFRNVEDNSVTDRFEKGENGVMYLAAKDYLISIDDQWHMGMETRPVNVTVNYSPTGMDTWTDLSIAEMPELFDEYTFGYIYAADLGQVKSSSDNKWYDLKIVLSDEAGNWQEQVISPAFRIEDGFTSINEVETDSKAIAVARYTIDGRRIATPQVGVNIVKYSDGSARKVIVK